MKIDRNNYEAFMIDYFDGNLSDADISVLFDFLNTNEDIKREFLEFQEINVATNSTLTFSNKNELKHIDSTTEFSNGLFDAFAIGYIENELSEKQQNEFLSAVNKNNSFQNEFDLYKSSKIEPDESIVFENKDSLKHKTINIFSTPLRYAVAVAAMFVVFYSLYKLNDKPEIRLAYVPRVVEESLLANIIDDDMPLVFEEKALKSKNVDVVYNKETEINLVAENNAETFKFNESVSKIKKLAPQNIERKVFTNENNIEKREVNINEINNIPQNDNKTNSINKNSIKDLALNFVKEKLLKVDDSQTEKILVVDACWRRRWTAQ